MRLHPINDGVTRRPDERTVTAAPFWFKNADGTPFRNRESLATEIARRSSDEVATGARTATMVAGVAYSFTTDRFGNEIDRRVERTTELGDEPLPRVAFRRQKKSPRVSTPRTEGRTATPRDTSDVDKIIRKTGYTGPIDRRMRRLARDAMSHNASLAAYING